MPVVGGGVHENLAAAGDRVSAESTDVLAVDVQRAWRQGGRYEENAWTVNPGV